MERFAKVFEAHGRQLLVKKSFDDDDRPKLSLIVMAQDAELDMGFSFPEGEVGEGNRDKVFDEFDQEKAEKYLKTLEGAEYAHDMILAMREDMQGDHNNG